MTTPRITKNEERTRCLLCETVPDVAIPVRGLDGICEPCARRAVAHFDRHAETIRQFRASQAEAREDAVWAERVR